MTNKACLSLLNLSNVHDYKEITEDALRVLFDTKLPTILLYSTSGAGAGKKLTIRITSHVNDYKKIYSSFADIGNESNLKIFSYVKGADLFSLNKVNKHFNRITKFYSLNENNLKYFKEETFSLEYLTATFLFRLNQYKNIRNKNHPVVTLFDQWSSHKVRIENFSRDILSILKSQAQVQTKENDHISFSLTHLLGYQLLHNRLKFDDSKYGIFQVDFSSENIKSFFDFETIHYEKFSLVELAHSKLAHLLVMRLAIELDYAQRNKSHNYEKCLTDSAKLIANALPPDFNEYLNNLIKTRKAKLLEIQNDPSLWNHCYVWRGTGENFKIFSFANPRLAKSYYSNGRNGYTSYTSGGGEGAGDYEVFHETVPGTECSLAYFYPYRERADEWKQLIKIIENFQVKVLDMDLESKPTKELKS